MSRDLPQVTQSPSVTIGSRMWQRLTSMAFSPGAFVVLSSATLVLPTRARGQGQTTVRVAATVVPASASIDGLHATQQAIDLWVSNREASNDVSMPMQVEVAAGQPSRGAMIAAEPRTLVIDVLYLKN
jgi:hypothetical protein